MPSLPRGPVARVEPQPSHEAFIQAAEPDWVCLRINHARQLVLNGETADSWTPAGTNVLTTTTIPDELLADLSWVEEYNIVKHLEPDAHIPTDVAVYPWLLHHKRAEYIEQCMEGVVWMHSELEDTQTTMIPLIKGYTQREREICYTVFDQLPHNFAVHYATKYFSGQGNNRGKLFQNLEVMQEEGGIDELGLIGLLGPNYLEKTPGLVTGAAGFNQWFKRISPTEMADAEMHAIYRDLAADVRSALEVDGSTATDKPAAYTRRSGPTEAESHLVTYRADGGPRADQ